MADSLPDGIGEESTKSFSHSHKQTETPSKGCLCSYLVIRFLDSLRSLEMTVGR